MKYIIALDQGTTSSRAILFDEKGRLIGVQQKEFAQHFPKPGWVEHDPEEIWTTQLQVLMNLIKKSDISLTDIVAIGITNQRETTVIWNKLTGEPIYNAIVWQDKRTSNFCEQLKKDGYSDAVKSKTGLVLDSYFSGTKVNWILNNVSNAKQLAEKGELCFGTVDSWLLWKLTKGTVHATDYTNASRTMMYNIVQNGWDDDLLSMLEIPSGILPDVYPSGHYFGDFDLNGHTIPIMGVAGDQQAALFGQACFESGDAKNTYGTGCFMLMNTGHKCKFSENGLLTTLACSVNDNLTYALEGSVFIAGAAVQWLRDGLEIIEAAADSEPLAKQADTNEVIFVPAFAGLGAPYWDQYSRGAIFGLTRDTGKNHIVKAALQSIAYQTKDVFGAMEEDSGIKISSLKVDGGATANDFLMQFQSDILGSIVDRPIITESTALGAAYLAGITAGVWTVEQIKRLRKTEKLFMPQFSDSERERLYAKWQKAVKRTLNWIEDESI